MIGFLKRRCQIRQNSKRPEIKNEDLHKEVSDDLEHLCEEMPDNLEECFPQDFCITLIRTQYLIMFFMAIIQTTILVKNIYYLTSNLNQAGCHMEIMLGFSILWLFHILICVFNGLSLSLHNIQCRLIGFITVTLANWLNSLYPTLIYSLIDYKCEIQMRKQSPEMWYIFAFYTIYFWVFVGCVAGVVGVGFFLYYIGSRK